MFARPVLCLICRCPVVDTGVRVVELSLEKFVCWWQQQLPNFENDELDGISEAQICQFCLWDAKSKGEAQMVKEEYNWWTGHDTNDFFKKYYYRDGVIRPCKVKIAAIELPEVSATCDLESIKVEVLDRPDLLGPDKLPCDSPLTRTAVSNAPLAVPSHSDETLQSERKWLRCHQCLRKESSAGDLWSHCLKHHPSGASTDKKWERVKSVRVVSGDGCAPPRVGTLWKLVPFVKCCGVTHTQKNTFELHVEKSVRCKLCLRFSERLQQHLEQCHGPPRIKCDELVKCRRTFGSLEERRMHVLEDHGTNNPSLFVKCPYCPCRAGRGVMRKHVQDIHNAVVIYCTYKGCVFHCGSSEERDRHIVENHFTFPKTKKTVDEVLLRSILLSETRIAPLEEREASDDSDETISVDDDHYSEPCPDSAPELQQGRSTPRVRKRASVHSCCAHCGKRCASRNEAFRHLAVAHPDLSTHVCSTCHAHFKFSRDLALHEATSHKRLRCHQCPFEEDSVDSMWYHIYSVHQKGRNVTFSAPRSVTCCDAKIATKTELLIHLSHLTECVCCGELCETARLELHMDECLHGASATKCHYAGCNIYFLDEEEKKKHVRSVHERHPQFLVPCPYCPCNFFSSKLIFHVIQVHRAEAVWCPVEFCTRFFHSVQDQLQHLAEAHSGVKFAGARLAGCVYCGELVHNLPHHVQTCHKADQVSCGFVGCATYFLHRFDLLSHVVVSHTGDGSIRCTRCDLRVETVPQLKKHFELRHAAERFDCPHCRMAHGSFESLRAHYARAHPPPRGRRSCQHCSKQYTDLKRHQRTSVCARCGKKYRCNFRALAHLRKCSARENGKKR